MPKIIPNLKEKILEEAKNQVVNNGYTGTTIRSIANALGVGVGTIYNYFKSKEYVVASFMIVDWKETINKMRNYPLDDNKLFIKNLIVSFREFIDRYSFIFEDNDALRTFAVASGDWHKILRGQITDIVRKINIIEEKDDFIYDFIAESIIVWTTEGKDFETQYSVLEKMI